MVKKTEHGTVVVLVKNFPVLAAEINAGIAGRLLLRRLRLPLVLRRLL